MESKFGLARRLTSLAIYCIMAVIVAYLIADSHPPTLAVGEVPALDEQFLLLNGRPSSVRRMLRKPVLINFWATWCSPCLRELPILSNAAKKYRASVTFLGAAVDSPQSSVSEFKAKYFLDYEHALVTDTMVGLWQARTLPTTYLLDKTGKIVWAHAGTLTAADLDEAMKLLR